MPIYDYLCETCGPFEAKRPMSESKAQAACILCSAPAPRVLCAPRLNLMSANNRYAETRNEKSAHEPDVVHRMPAPHGHEKHHHHAHGPAHRHKPHAPKRPWMLGH